MATVLLGGRKLADLRVVDLRQELEKRGLEKSGVKAVLLERLQKVTCTVIFWKIHDMAWADAGGNEKTLDKLIPKVGLASDRSVLISVFL